MSLGEAFVEIRADLRPFGRDLHRSVRPMVEAFERELNGAVGRAMLAHASDDGHRVGDRLSRGIKRSMTEQFRHKNAFVVIAAALGSALDDGISALPTEVKAALVAGILAALPIIGGALAGAIAAAVGVGLVGLGITLASQFDIVQERAVAFGRSVRRELVEAARAFVPAIFQAFSMIETRVRMLRPMLDEIFSASAGFLEPLTEGALDAVEEIFESIFTSLDDIKPFVDELGVAFKTLGDAIGKAIEILVSSGEDGQKALRDLVALIGAAIISAALLLKFFARLWGVIRQIFVSLGELAGPFSVIAGLIAKILKMIDERANRDKAYINTNADVEASIEGVISATKGETDALKEYRDAIAAASDAARSNLELNLSWEESLDRITDSLKENGKTLDIHTEKGRANINEFLRGLEVAEERALLRVQRGEMTSQQAADQYQKEVQELKNLATQAGISEREFNDLFNEIVLTSSLRISAEEMGITGLNGELANGRDVAAELFRTLQMIKHLGSTIGGGAVGGVRGFADGGIHYLPQIVRVAEEGAEVTIPLTKPARAAHLAQQSGLAQMLGSMGQQDIYVFIGNDQLDSRMVRIASKQSQAQALALNQGGRSF